MTPSSKTPALSAEERWKLQCALQSIYATLVREFVIEVQACVPLDENQTPSQEIMSQVEAWMQQVDAQIGVHQVRQFSSDHHARQRTGPARSSCSPPAQDDQDAQ